MNSEETFPDYPIFINVLTEITGRHRITSEDPRWIQLFGLNCLEFLMAKPEYLIEFNNRWTLNNPITRNLNLFFEQVLSRLKFLAKRRTGSNLAICQECCLGLFLGTMVLQHLLSNFDIREVKEQLGLPANWPPDEAELRLQVMNRINSSTTGALTNSSALLFETFLEGLVSILSSSNTDLHDVRFFAIECLIVLLSSSMYKTHFLNSSYPLQSNEDFQPADIFSQYFCLRSFVEMKISYTIPNDSVFFSKILSVRLIKSLVTISLADPRFIRSNHFYEQEQQQGTLLPQIYRRISNSHQQYLQITRSRSKPRTKSSANSNQKVALFPTVASSSSSYDQMVSLMRQMFLGIMKRIPLPVIQQLIPESNADLLPTTVTTENIPSHTEPNDLTSDASTTSLPSQPESTHDSHHTSFFHDLKEIQGLPQLLLRERSCQLLLLLLHQRKLGSVVSFNPFRQAFNLLVDESLEANGNELSKEEDNDIEMVNSKSYSSALSVLKIHIEFSQIVEMLCKLLPNHNFSLLLYSFLQIHSSFTESLRITNQTTPIMLKCLEGLYISCVELNEIMKNTINSVHTTTNGSMNLSASVDSTNNSLSHTHHQQPSRESILNSIESMERVNDIYLFIINLLILVQDCSLVEIIGSQKITVPAWFKERPNVEMKLVDFLIISLLKTLCFAVFRLQDQYLVANIHAIFMNIVCKVSDLHAYTSERWMKTMVLFGKRIFQKLQLVEKWSQSVDHQTTPLSRIHSSSMNSLVDYFPHETTTGSVNTSSTSRSEEITLPLGAELNQLQSLYQELAMYKTVLSQLLFFATIIVRQRFSENPSFLYAVILQYEVLSRYLLAKGVDMFLSDKTSISEEEEEIVSSTTRSTISTNAAEERPEFHRYILKIGKDYLQKIEHSRGEKKVDYFTAKEAMKILVEEIQKTSTGKVDPIASSGRDLENNETTADPIFLQYNDLAIEKSLHEFSKSRYLYEEADNPDEFFLPYIWTNIILTTPELLWKLPNIHHFARLYH